MPHREHSFASAIQHLRNELDIFARAAAVFNGHFQVHDSARLRNVRGIDIGPGGLQKTVERQRNVQWIGHIQPDVAINTTMRRMPVRIVPRYLVGLKFLNGFRDRRIEFRLHRGKKRCKAEKRKYRKCPELAAELIKLLADTLPERRIIVVGDSAYTNGSIIKGRPNNVTIVGRSRLDAALYAPAPARGPNQMGRPRVRGARLPSPEKQTAKARFKRIEVTVYGRTVMVRVLVIDALWYVAAHSELVRLVVVRDFPGHERDDVFVSTDPTITAKSIIETFARRWSLEHTFHECKGKLGFEEPQNRTDRAVERTAPMSLWLHTLVVLWYLRTGQHSRAARQPSLPWYKKTAPTFSDMLATLRRASWAQRLSDPCANVQTLRKRMRPLVEALAA